MGIVYDGITFVALVLGIDALKLFLMKTIFLYWCPQFYSVNYLKLTKINKKRPWMALLNMISSKQFRFEKKFNQFCSIRPCYFLGL